MMRPAYALLAISLLASASFAGAQTQPLPPPTSLASMVDREISAVEQQLLDAAEAMADDKFNFTPESLTISGDDYKGVRSFAVQVKHVASSNLFDLVAHYRRCGACSHQGRQRPGGHKDQSRDPEIPEGLFRAGS